MEQKRKYFKIGKFSEMCVETRLTYNKYKSGSNGCMSSWDVVFDKQ